MSKTIFEIRLFKHMHTENYLHMVYLKYEIVSCTVSPRYKHQCSLVIL